MAASVAMPNLVVEVAFNAGFSTPAASRTWTDISDYVELAEGLTIAHGRQDRRGIADANTLSLTLDNTDGRFTAGLATGAYFPNVKLYRPIRVRATTVAADGSVTTTRFTGYVMSWPVTWNKTDAYSKVQITASSRLQRLGLNRAWRSIVEQNILLDGPTRYFTLGEPEGADRANDSSGNGGDPLMQVGSGNSVVFGQATGPGTDSLTAATFSGGRYLVGALSVTNDFTIEGTFLRNGTPTTNESIAYLQDATGTTFLAIRCSNVGTLTVYDSATTYYAGSGWLDGNTHHFAVTSTGGSWSVYVDGTSVATVASATPAGYAELRVGGGQETLLQPAYTLNGVVSHIAVHDTALSAARVAAHAGAALTGHAGDTTDARFVRYTTLAGIPTAEVSAEASTITTAFVDTTDQQVVDMLRLVEATEAGVMFDDRDGTLRLHNRAHRYGTSAIYTLDMSKHMVEADYSPTLDNSFIFNDVSVQNVAGMYSAHVVDATSVGDYGVNAVSAETASENPDEPLNLASWWVYAFKDPRTRVPTLAVNVLAQVGKTPNSAAILATNVGDKITVSNQPAQAPASTASYFVEGYTEQWLPEQCVMTFNVSDVFPESTVLIVDDPVFGAVDTYAVAL